MRVLGLYTDGIRTAAGIKKEAVVKGLSALFLQRTVEDGLEFEKESLIPWSTKGGFAITLHTTPDKVRIEGENIYLDAAEAEALVDTYRTHLAKALDIYDSYGQALFGVFHIVEVGDEDVFYKVIVKKKDH